MTTRQSALGNGRARRRGFAILMVVLVLVALAIIAAPFAISMRQEEHASLNFAARSRAKLAAQGARNWAMAQLERSHEYFEDLESRQGSPPTVFNSPQVDAGGEFRVDLTSPLLTEGEIGLDIDEHQGVMWGVAATDEQGKVNVKSASRAFLRNLLELLFGTARGHAVADAIVQYRDVDRRQFTSLTQLREIAATLTAAEYDRMAGFLTVHSAALVGDVPSGKPALHPVNINTCTEEVLRAWLLGLKLTPQDGLPDHDGVTAEEVNNLVLGLRVFRTLGASVSEGATSVLLDNAVGLPEYGWVAIEGDAVHYTARTGNRLTVADPVADNTIPLAARVDEDHPRLADVSTADVEVRLLFTDIENDFASILEAMAANGELSEGSRSAILANAINPRNDDALEVTTTTAPLCFRSFNIYTIEATGVVNAQDGRELARYTVREVAQVAPVGDLEIRIETQADFERSIVSDQSHLVASFPNATQVSDIPAQNLEPPAESPTPAIMMRRGRLGLEAAEVTPVASTTFVARYDGEMRDNTLWAEPDLSRMPEPDALTTVKVEPGEQGDIEPEGIHVGVREIEGEDADKRILVYQARNDEEIGNSNIPHGGEYVRPFIVEMWVKFDPKDKFDYSRDHFLLDLAETTFVNRICLYYDSTGSDEGDLVLSVCDATLQELPAQIRVPVQSDTFEPQRWYHLAAVVKGIGYNQMALLINGQAVGRYEPSAALASDVAKESSSIACDDLARYLDAKFFGPYRWPVEDTAILGGELFEHQAAGTSNFTGCTRGARGTQARRHFSGSRVEIYGYDDLLRQGSWHYNDCQYPIPHLLKAGDEPFLTKNLPAEMAPATVNDGDEQSPPVAPTIAIDLTADETTEYWSPAASKYEAAALDGNAIPTEGWLPIAFSEMWLVEGKDTAITDDADQFAAVAEDETLQAFLLYNDTGGTLSTTQREIEDANNGLGFLKVEANDGGDGDEKGEVIKYSRAGVVLVWRLIAEDDAETEDVDETKKAAWYIGYLAGFGGAAAEGEPAATAGRRACFETEEAEIVEGATLRFDCIKLTHNLTLPRGHREEVSWTYTDINGAETEYDMGRLSGRGIFQLYRSEAYYEWAEFSWPQYKAEADELALLGNKFVVGIYRARADTVTDGNEHQGRAFLAGGADKILPVFFTHNQVRVMNQYLPIIKGPGDDVTLLDRKGDRKEAHEVNHGYGHMFAFREPVEKSFLYADSPRVLKFPSGSLPMQPDKLLYIGSDATVHNGDPADPFTEGGTHTSRVGDPAEPERPANATFDEIKIYPAGSYATAGLYDFDKTSNGEPETTKSGRWQTFSSDSDAPPISNSLEPPFYIRIGHLERISPKPPEGQEFAQPFRFISNGHASWPMEGYLKIDDECMFYRTMYYNRSGGRSAKMLFQPGKPKDPDGLTYALRKGDNDLYVAFEEGEDFPEQGYITFSSSWPSKTYWERFAQVAGDSGQGTDALWTWLQGGNFILSEGGGRMGSSGHVSHQERLFYEGKERTTVNGQDAWKLQIAHRAILDSSLAEAKYVDPDSPPSWYLDGMTSEGGANCRVFPCELLVLRRACLGTDNADQKTRHSIGTIVMPLEHIPTSLTPRPVVKLRRDLETGKLARDPDDDALLLTLDDDHVDFDITRPEYEYGVVVEDRDGFPEAGYVQIGDEILAYAQDENGTTPVWNAKARIWDQAQGKFVAKILPVLTGIKHFRQRYGTARASYLDYKPGQGDALESLDPGVPDPEQEPGSAGSKIQPTPPYWEDHGDHIVHVREFRYYDRYPQVEPTSPTAEPSTYVGKYAPHRDDRQLAYYEFAVTMPGTLWTRVQWAELLYRKKGTDWALSNDPLDDTDPYDVKLLVQIDGQPGWDDMTMDKAVTVDGAGQPPQPVASPVHWRDFASRTDAYDKDDGSHRPLKPVIFLFDEAYDPDDSPSSRPRNYINPSRSGTATLQRGQYGDRLRLRVLFQYRNKDIPAPDYDVPWRTPWVDTILINYKAPTHVMEHREMPY